MTALCIYFGRPLRIYESYLIAASYGLFFVLLAYFAAFLSFYPAWLLSILIAGGLLLFYLRWVLPLGAARHVMGLIVSSLCVPTAAVFLQGYTSLIYTLEILALLTTMMVLTTRPKVRELIERLLTPAAVEGESHAA